MQRKLILALLIIELIMLAALILIDLGVLTAGFEPTSSRSMMLHFSVIILIIGSAVGLNNSKK